MSENIPISAVMVMESDAKSIVNTAEYLIEFFEKDDEGVYQYDNVGESLDYFLTKVIQSILRWIDDCNDNQIESFYNRITDKLILGEINNINLIINSSLKQKLIISLNTLTSIANQYLNSSSTLKISKQLMRLVGKKRANWREVLFKLSMGKLYFDINDVLATNLLTKGAGYNFLKKMELSSVIQRENPGSRPIFYSFTDAGLKSCNILKEVFDGVSSISDRDEDTNNNTRIRYDGIMITNHYSNTEHDEEKTVEKELDDMNPDYDRLIQEAA